MPLRSPPPVDASWSRSRHDEWLLDEAVFETFPASDPIAPFVPDAATLATRAASRRGPRRSGRRARGVPEPMWVALAAAFCVGFVAGRRVR
jgi:hypothetical protein